eukprot:scaffold57263_cov66-Phaeocystis_antarctica.AAC.1
MLVRKGEREAVAVRYALFDNVSLTPPDEPHRVLRIDKSLLAAAGSSSFADTRCAFGAALSLERAISRTHSISRMSSSAALSLGRAMSRTHSMTRMSSSGFLAVGE